MESIAFHDALILGKDSIVFVQTSVDASARHRRGEEPACATATPAGTCAPPGRIRAWSGPEPRVKPWQPQIEPPAHFDGSRFYRQLRAEGHEFGPAFQGVETIWREHGQVLGLVRRRRQVDSAAAICCIPRCSTVASR